MWWLSTVLALASPIDDLGGLEIADVRLVAPEGGLPDENLESLFEARMGQPLQAWDVRTDLATLMRVGEFSAVEADVTPWFIETSEGDLTDAVLVTYLVWPAPRIDRIQFEGHTELRERVLRDEIGLAPGDVYYPDLSDPPAIARLLGLYQSRG